MKWDGEVSAGEGGAQKWDGAWAGDVAEDSGDVPECTRAGLRWGAWKVERTGEAHGAARERASARGQRLSVWQSGPAKQRGKRGARAKGTDTNSLAPLGRERERVSAWGQKPPLTCGAHLSGGAGARARWGGWAGLG